ncbi:tripartite tricarboxylate transporter permease [Falsiroseomonas stagni]|uniref:Tripartite tricarboxylate transporter TctA family protein n=1 Tax=Falsiroseomonas stagni DSM 19981 TaxID=1123062 RepID=A0A1I4B9A3_9PROT|nr:tripartite tricarboxylate transporter permease [Falsiroseomonas stagni]SFK65354.1 Tripartite tricarboxylate transporter TctA family protein [Falsiroseomonas stagni DSM 19981]
MTEALAMLGAGLGPALLPGNLLLCLAGVALGTLVGVLPGLGPVATIALLLPVTFALPPAGALIMLAGIYYGAQYGSSTTAILLRVPGEASGVVTAQEGHLLARAGRAGPALGIAALASLLGGVIAALVLALLLAPLARFAIAFGPAETAALMLLGVAAAVALSPAPLLAAWALAAFGALLGLVGTDVAGGRPRFTFGIPELADGIGFIPLAMGLFGVAELIRALESGGAARRTLPVGSPWPARRDVSAAAGPALRGSVIGSAIGLLPGASTLLAALAAQAAERGLFRRRGRWGQGEMAGVAAPEAANNAAAQTSFAPLLALGLPANAAMAVLAGAMFLQGIAPGPGVVAERPDLVGAIIISMLVGNAMLVALNLPFVGLWAALLRLPLRLLAALVIVLCCGGLWASSGSVFDLWLLLGFAILGWALSRAGLDPTPLLIGFTLAAPFEEALRRALVLARGDWSVFLQEPASATLLAAAAATTALAAWMRRRPE